MKTVSIVETTPTSKCIRQMFAYRKITIDFVQMHYITLISFMSRPYTEFSEGIVLHFLSTSLALLKSVNCWYTVPLTLPFFFSFRVMLVTWSVVDRLRPYKHCWSPLVSSTDGVNKRIASNKILYRMLSQAAEHAAGRGEKFLKILIRKP
jgi:hypothetical protein